MVILKTDFSRKQRKINHETIGFAGSSRVAWVIRLDG
jgi:hypothetical protein